MAFIRYGKAEGNVEAAKKAHDCVVVDFIFHDVGLQRHYYLGKFFPLPPPPPPDSPACISPAWPLLRPPVQPSEHKPREGWLQTSTRLDGVDHPCSRHSDREDRS